jgi:hypothetical protein
MDSKVLMIISTGRAGTSVITQWINKCGLAIGDNLLGEAIGNIEGHFEDLDFLKMHEEILLSNNLPSTGIEPVDDLKISVEQKEKLKKIIANKNNLHPQWGWKEPRTSLFLNIYKELIPQAKYLVIIRDYKAVLHSFLKRDFAYIEKEKLAQIKGNAWENFTWNLFSKKRAERKYYAEHAEKYLKRCIGYNEAIIKAMDKLSPTDYIVVSYTYLKDNDKKVIESLTNDSGFSLNYFPFAKIYRDELISEATSKITQYIKDKSLLLKAKELENIITTRMK